MASPYGRRKITSYDIYNASDEWRDLGTRYERFESQPPTDDEGQHVRLKFRQRRALRTVQAAIDATTGAHVSTGSGRRTRIGSPSFDQLRHERWWRGRVRAILNNEPYLQAAEQSAQVIHLSPQGVRRAA